MPACAVLAHGRAQSVCQTPCADSSKLGSLSRASASRRPALRCSLAHKATAPAVSPFHLAFPVHDVTAARHFYTQVLGCTEGRSASTWQDFSLYGHQIVAHEVGPDYSGTATVTAVDGDPVPVPHFGLALTTEQFHSLAERLRDAGVHFEIEPHMRFSGQPGEQWTMFFKDQSSNCLEFKAMTNPDNLFAKYEVKE